MAEAVVKKIETQRSPSAGPESSQRAILDVLSRGLETAKQQMDARQPGAGREVQRVCAFIYWE